MAKRVFTLAWHSERLGFKPWQVIKNLIVVGYQPKKIRWRRHEQKLNKNDQYATQSWVNESRFNYLCLNVGSFLLYYPDVYHLQGYEMCHKPSTKVMHTKEPIQAGYSYNFFVCYINTS